MLLAHLILFGFIYPSGPLARCPPRSPASCSTDCSTEIDAPDADDPVCYGTLLSWSQYLGDVFGGSISATPGSVRTDR